MRCALQLVDLLFSFRSTGKTVIGVCVNIAYLISVLIYPYMPVTSLIIRRQLNIDQQDLADLIKGLKLDGGTTPFPTLPEKFQCFVKAGHKIGKAEPLFRQIKDDEINGLKTRFAGKQDAAAESATASIGNKKKPKAAAATTTVASGGDAVSV